MNRFGRAGRVTRRRDGERPTPCMRTGVGWRSTDGDDDHSLSLPLARRAPRFLQKMVPAKMVPSRGNVARSPNDLDSRESWCRLGPSSTSTSTSRASRAAGDAREPPAPAAAFPCARLGTIRKRKKKEPGRRSIEKKEKKNAREIVDE